MNEQKTDLKSTRIAWLTLALTAIIGLTASAQADTTYIKSYYTKFVPRILYNYKIQEISFTNKNSDTTYYSAKFSTGDQFQAGGAFSYKWVNLGYAFSLSPNSTKRNMDLRFSTGYRPFQLQFNLTYLRNLNYTLENRSYETDLQDTIVSHHENEIAIITSKLKVDYVFNYRHYSYSAGFTPSGRQLKSAGSFIASGAISNDNIALDHLSEVTKPQFDSIHGFSNVLINSFDLGAGYGFNWVINPHWTMCFMEMPKIGLQFIKITDNKPENYFFTVGFVNHFKGGILYTNKRFFTGLYAYSLVNVSKLKTGNYSNAYNSVSLYCGWVLDAKMKKRKKNSLS